MRYKGVQVAFCMLKIREINLFDNWRLLFPFSRDMSNPIVPNQIQHVIYILQSVVKS